MQSVDEEDIQPAPEVTFNPVINNESISEPVPPNPSDEAKLIGDQIPPSFETEKTEVELGQTISNMMKTSAQLDISAFGTPVTPQESHTVAPSDNERAHPSYQINIIKEEENEDELTQSQNPALKLTPEEIEYFEKQIYQEEYMKRNDRAQQEAAPQSKSAHQSKPQAKLFPSIEDEDEMGHSRLTWQCIYLFSDVFLALISWCIFDGFISELYYITHTMPFWVIALVLIVGSLLPLLMLFQSALDMLKESFNYFNVLICVVLFLLLMEDQYVHVIVLAFGRSAYLKRCLMSILIIVITCTLDRTHPRKHRIYYSIVLGLVFFTQLRYVFHANNLFFNSTFTVLLLLIGLTASIVLIFERKYYNLSRKKVLKTAIAGIKHQGDFGKTVSNFLQPPHRRAPELKFDKSQYHITRKDLKDMIVLSKVKSNISASAFDGESTFAPSELEEIMRVLESSIHSSSSFLEWSRWWRWPLHSIGFASLLFITFFLFTENGAFSRYLNLPVSWFPPVITISIILGFLATRFLSQVPKLLCGLVLVIGLAGAVLFFIAANSLAGDDSIDLKSTPNPLAIVALVLLSLCFSSMWLIKLRELVEEAERGENILDIDLLPLISSFSFFIFFTFFFMALLVWDGTSLLSTFPSSSSSYIVAFICFGLILLTSAILKGLEYYYDLKISDSTSSVFWRERMEPLPLWNKASYVVIGIVCILLIVGGVMRNLQLNEAEKNEGAFSVTSWSINKGFRAEDFPGQTNYPCISSYVTSNFYENQIFCLQGMMSYLLNGHRDSTLPVYFSSSSKHIYYGFPSVSTYSGTSLVSTKAAESIFAYPFQETVEHHRFSYIYSRFNFNATDINLFCVELDPNINPQGMIQQIVDHSDQVGGPAIIMGSFGLSPNGTSTNTPSLVDGFQSLKQKGFSSAINPSLSCSPDGTGECEVADDYVTLFDTHNQADYIWYRNLTVISAEHSDTLGCSNHFPIRASFVTQ